MYPGVDISTSSGSAQIAPQPITLESSQMEIVLSNNILNVCSQSLPIALSEAVGISETPTMPIGWYTMFFCLRARVNICSKSLSTGIQFHKETQTFRQSQTDRCRPIEKILSLCAGAIRP